jgi:uncharacterized repeat protein (TIGR03803 family)
MQKRFSLLSRCVALAFVALAISMPAHAQTYTYSILYSFQNNGTDPANPNFLIIDSEGNLYGTSDYGGSHGFGSVFELTPNGGLTVLHNFAEADALANSLVRDNRQGNLYGTTLGFGSPGTVFELVKGSDGTYTLSTLYSDKGSRPQSVTLDSQGNLYGTDDGDCICVFEIPAGGHWNNIYSYGVNPVEPQGNVLISPSGNVYFSIDDEENGGGGWVTELNVTVFGIPAGYGPDWLVQDSAGNIYGLATIMEDDPDGTGLIFKIDTSGNVTTIFGFPGNAGGKQPFGPFAMDAAGNIYGTVSGGKEGTGVVFKVSPEREETVLHTFSDDAYHVGLVMDAAGNLYGTSTAGGSAGLGYVWKLTVSN